MARAREAISKPTIPQSSGARPSAASRAIANADGVEHLHLHPDMPEAAEVRSLVEGMKGVNTDHARYSPPIFNPLTSKGEKIMDAMRGTYKSAKKAKQVFYASANKGRITGVHK